MDKYRVTLTEEERGELQQLISAGKAAARKLTHARVLLLADATSDRGYPDGEIAEALGVSHLHWTFTLAAARRKLRNLYPSIED